MSDAPERVWVDPETLLAYRDDHGDGHPLYVRADIHQRDVDNARYSLNGFQEMRRENARLREALEEIITQSKELGTLVCYCGHRGHIIEGIARHALEASDE